LYFNKKIQQKKWIYSGEKHLWVNGLSASASVDFTQAWKKNNLGTVWGQCVMGNEKGTFGNGTITLLPQSKLPISIATIRYNYDKQFDFESPNICPDIRIEYSIENIMHGTDPYWSAFRKKI
jgi:C-terminal processing protease CtpA/Prc